MREREEWRADEEEKEEWRADEDEKEEWRADEEEKEEEPEEPDRGANCFEPAAELEMGSFELVMAPYFPLCLIWPLSEAASSLHSSRGLATPALGI